MIIREKNNDEIVGYELSVDSKSLIELQKQELEKINEHISYLQIMSSWGNKEEFLKFINQDIHMGYDFYYDRNFINSGGNDYMTIRKLYHEFAEKKQYYGDKPFDHTFRIRDNFYDEKGENVCFNKSISSLTEDGEVHYAIFDINDIVHGGGHTSVGYHNDSVIQVTEMIYVIDKLLKLKAHLNNKLLQKPDYDKLLSYVSAKQIGIQKLSDIEMQFDNEDAYQEHINKMIEAEGMVVALKKANRI